MLTTGAILEGLITTRNADGSTNLAAIGPIVDENFTRAVVRPFPTSVTYANLLRERRGVLHVTDDVLLVAQAALDGLAEPPHYEETPSGQVLANCCRWFALEVDEVNLEGERPEFHSRLTARGVNRDFFGLSRAKLAVIEAAILASRALWLPPEEISRKMGELGVVVDKTGSPRDRAGYDFVANYLEHLPHDAPDTR